MLLTFLRCVKMTLVAENSNLNVTTALVAVGVLCLYALYRSSKRPHGFPPGPMALPVLGNVTTFMTKKSSQVFQSLRQKYGDIYSLVFGGWYVVILNNSDLVREAFLKKPVEFAGRPKISSVEALTNGYKDIAFSDYGPQWKYQRKLAHSAIRHFCQKEQLERIVSSVTPDIANVLDHLGDKPFAPKWTIGQIVYNVLATLCFGKVYKFNQPELKRFIDINVEMLESFGNGIPSDFIPALQYLPNLYETKFEKLIREYLQLFETELKEHQACFDPDNVRDFFDSLLATQKEALEAGEEEAARITDEHLVQTIIDIFEAGTETTILTLHWAIALLAEHPNIQEKMATEIDTIVGQERLPSLDDRGTLPYTEATILEIFRCGAVAPVGLPHCAMKDTTLSGYKIPKGTVVMANILALHFNEKDFPEPDEFKPERFLNDNGDLVSKLPDGFLPFSCGRRVCLGEDFAKREVFLLLTWLFSRYSFYKVPGRESESLLKLNEVSALAHQLPDGIEVCVKKRY